MMLEHSRDLVLDAFTLVHSPSRCAWNAELHHTSVPSVLSSLVLAPLAVLVYKTLGVLVSMIITIFRVSI